MLKKTNGLNLFEWIWYIRKQRVENSTIAAVACPLGKLKDLYRIYGSTFGLGLWNIFFKIEFNKGLRLLTKTINKPK